MARTTPPYDGQSDMRMYTSIDLDRSGLGGRVGIYNQFVYTVRHVTIHVYKDVEYMTIYKLMRSQFGLTEIRRSRHSRFSTPLRTRLVYICTI